MLERIYGESIVKSFTTRNENNFSLKMNDEAHNQKEKKNYDRKDGEGCKLCYVDFRNKENFFKRILEFPGWIRYLDFSGTTPAKEIMIIGEAPTRLKDQINIAFGLGYFPIKSNGKLNFVQLRKTYAVEEKLLEKIISNQTKKNKLWEYLNHLFSGKLEAIKPMIYITDLCKCNDDIKTKNKKERKNKKIWKICGDNYLIKEIELIKPKLIIFQGWSSYKYLKDYLIQENEEIKSQDDILENVELINKQYYREETGYSEKSLYYNPFYGKLPFNGNQIHFFVIFHQSNFTNPSKKNKYNRTVYVDRHLKFIKEKILTEVLNIS